MLRTIVARKYTALEALSRTKIDIYLPRESTNYARQKELQANRVEATRYVINTGMAFRK